MNSVIVSQPAPAAKPWFTFPGLFRSICSGSVWLAHDRTTAIRVFASPEAVRLSSGAAPAVGNLLGYTVNLRGETVTEVTPANFTQITSPITIQFNP